MKNKKSKAASKQLKFDFSKKPSCSKTGKIIDLARGSEISMKKLIRNVRRNSKSF